MSKQPDKYENFWRPAYEVNSALCWAAASVSTLLIGIQQDDALRSLAIGAVPCAIGSATLFKRALNVWMFKRRLNVVPPFIARPEDVVDNEKGLYLGRGFDWQPQHARRVFRINQLNKDEYRPPKVFELLYNLTAGRKIASLDAVNHGKSNFPAGAHYLHGVSPTEHDIYSPWSFQGLHTWILGSTGSGKTVTLQNILVSAGPTKRPIIILDPKSDPNLRDRAYIEAKKRGSNFFYFSPTNAHRSCRINLLQNYSRLSQIASRVASLMAGGGESQAYRDFAWRAINCIVEGLQASGDDITLKSLLRYIEGDIFDLICRALERHLATLSSHYPDWRSSTINRRPGADQAEKAAVLIKYYEQIVAPKHHTQTISSLIAICKHDRAHYQKLITSLIPILQQLTAGSVGELLSPDYDDPLDTREIVDLAKLIRRGDVLYVALENLSDSFTGSAIGSLLLSDLTSVMAARYNSGKPKHDPVTVIVDEAGELVNEPFIQALNKSRGAGFECYMCCQTLADLVVRLGSTDAALKVVGNVNTLISLRIRDDGTKDLVSKLFSETSFTDITKGSATSPYSASDNSDYTTTIAARESSEEIPFVSTDALLSLPDLHYYMRLPSGQRIKGRVTIFDLAPDERYPTDGRAINVPKTKSDAAINFGYYPTTMSSGVEVTKAA